MPKLFALGLSTLLTPMLAAHPETAAQSSDPELRRVSYTSAATGEERDYFVYLPRGHTLRERWPVILFLHGNGERGNGTDELDYVLMHGPLFEAWVQRRDLPFVIISPQLPIYGMGEVEYIRDRSPSDIPRRLPEGRHRYPPNYEGEDPMDGQLAEIAGLPPEGPPEGWFLFEDELLGMIRDTVNDFRGDPRQVHLTGLSYGGFGTWHLGSRHPDVFASLAPVVAFGHPDHAPPIAAARTPIWVFAGGRDVVVPPRAFYPAVNALEAEGHPEVRFTIHADLGHDAWHRIYASADLYDWMLAQSR